MLSPKLKFCSSENSSLSHIPLRRNRKLFRRKGSGFRSRLPQQLRRAGSVPDFRVSQSEITAVTSRILRKWVFRMPVPLLGRGISISSSVAILSISDQRILWSLKILIFQFANYSPGWLLFQTTWRMNASSVGLTLSIHWAVFLTSRIGGTTRRRSGKSKSSPTTRSSQMRSWTWKRYGSRFHGSRVHFGVLQSKVCRRFIKPKKAGVAGKTKKTKDHLSRRERRNRRSNGSKYEEKEWYQSTFVGRDHTASTLSVFPSSLPDKYPGLEVRKSRRWIEDTFSPKGDKLYSFPYQSIKGKFSGCRQITTKCFPSQYISTVLATTVKRLREHCLKFNKPSRVHNNRTLLVKVAFYYCVSKNSWFWDRIISLTRDLKARGRFIHSFVKKFMLKMDGYSRFVYNQAKFQANWFYARATWPRDKSKYQSDPAKILPAGKTSVEYRIRKALTLVSARFESLCPSTILTSYWFINSLGLCDRKPFWLGSRCG